jgi:L-rhamnose mutarotase
MSRSVLAVDLKDDPAAVAAYMAFHQQVWQEVIQSLRSAGIRQMEIYLLARRLVMVVETDDGDVRRAFAAHVASHPRVREWESLMKSMQEPAPGAQDGDWWTEMRPVFQLEVTDETIAPRETAQRR